MAHAYVMKSVAHANLGEQTSVTFLAPPTRLAQPARLIGLPKIIFWLLTSAVLIPLRHLPDGLDGFVPEPLRFDDLEISSPAQGPPKHLFRFRHIDLEEEAPVTVFGELLRRVA